MTTAFFQDGVPTETDLELSDLYVAYRLAKNFKATVRCWFRCMRRPILLDVNALDAKRTFGSMYREEDFV